MNSPQKQPKQNKEIPRAGSYYAQCARGLEEMLTAELSRLGASYVKSKFMGCMFETDKAGLYKINYTSRLASRILMPVARFDCWNDNDLYRHIHKLDWPAFFPVTRTFAVTALGKHPTIKHTKFAALRVKDAVVDAFRDKTGKRPDINALDPDIHLVLHMEPRRAILYWDTSGAPLHKRGYRVTPVDAPLQETVAAAMIELAKWDEKTPLIDPFCGSGTLLAEAYMKAARIPAGYLRKKWGFMHLPDFDETVWQQVESQADALIQSLPDGLIQGSDIDKSAVKAARNNFNTLPGGAQIPVARQDYKDIPHMEGMFIVANPPHGIRMQPGEMSEWIKNLGDYLKTRCSGSTAILYFGERELIKSVGLKPTFKFPLPSGGLDGRVVRYDLFSGRWEDRQ